MDSLAGKTVLVTGATGFLGGALARRLAADGAVVRALARDLSRADYLRGVENIEIVQGDIQNADQMRAAVQGCDYVFHSAAALRGSLEKQLAINENGTRIITEAAAEAGVKRFVHISTISVYGYKNEHDVSEETTPDPSHDAYGVSKLAAENALKEVAAARGLSFAIIRPGMIYGPRSGFWTGRFFRVAKRKPTIWLGNGSGSTYAIHVDDVVDLTVLLAVHPAAEGETFNGTPDPSPTWRAFLSGYSRLAGHQQWLGIPVAPLMPLVRLAAAFAPADSPRRDLPDILPFSQRYITYSMRKAKRLLDWEPRVTLGEGIGSCVPWLKEQGLLEP